VKAFQKEERLGDDALGWLSARDAALALGRSSSLVRVRTEERPLFSVFDAVRPIRFFPKARHADPR